MPQPASPFATAPMVDAIVKQAAQLATPGTDRPDAVRQLIALADGDRASIEEARNVYARHLHGRSDDWTATGALALLNRALTASGWIDPFDWKGRRKP
jgi:hypothetical protein